MAHDEGERIQIGSSSPGTALASLDQRRVLRFTMVFACTVMVLLVLLTVTTSTPGVKADSNILSEMRAIISNHGSDIASVSDTPETGALMTQAALMISLWDVPPGDYLNDCGAIVGFSFGQGPDKDGKPTPGNTNVGLAWSMAQMLNEYQAAGRERPLVMVQWEIADILKDVHGITADEVASVDADGNYLSTYGVMEQLAIALKRHEIDTVALVAHKDHAVRCGKVVQHFNVSALGTPYLSTAIPWDDFGCDQHGYWQLSAQPWTRSRSKYLMHEIWVRPRMVEQGQIDFSNGHFERLVLVDDDEAVREDDDDDKNDDDNDDEAVRDDDEDDRPAQDGFGATEPLKCGVASTVFTQTPSAMSTAVDTGKLSFWWNWDTTMKIDNSTLNQSTLSGMHASFSPMIWGTATPSDLSFLSQYPEGDVLGFNEPDQFGPACCNCDGKQTYAAATSSGWAPLFNPKSASQYWQNLLGTLTAKPGAAWRIVSPAMAQGAEKIDGVDCTADPSILGNSHFCHGWLSMFKEFALQMPCSDFSGQVSNCWDVIDSIQIHAYTKTAAEVKQKIREYYSVFKDDFEGVNNRTKKTLWLTEVAMGSSDGAAVSQFVEELMNPTDGLANRAAADQVFSPCCASQLASQYASQLASQFASQLASQYASQFASQCAAIQLVLCETHLSCLSCLS